LLDKSRDTKTLVKEDPRFPTAVIGRVLPEYVAHHHTYKHHVKLPSCQSCD
jgi:hypothetical protein